MEQDTVGDVSAATVDQPDDLMGMPSGHPCDRVPAFRAKSALPKPETKQLLLSFRASDHLHVKPTLKVRFPLRVVGVGGPHDLEMPDDRDGRGKEEPKDPRVTTLIRALVVEDPSPAVQVFEVLTVDPPGRLGSVSPTSPLPQAVEDGLVDFRERGLRGAVPVIVCPSPDNGVEHPYQVSGTHLFMGLDDSSDFSQECFNIPFGRPGKELAVVLAYVPSEEIKSLFDVRNPGLLQGEFQTPRLKELNDERFDFIFQHVFSPAGYDEVIGISNHVDQRRALPLSRKVLSKDAFETIESEV